MENTHNNVKVYNENKELLCSGHLLSINHGIIMIKGINLPIFDAKTKIIIEIYSIPSGISPYFCEISVSSYSQLNAKIIRTEPVTERRNALKVRTDLCFIIDTLYRNDENITNNIPKVIINILNLSVGGMLISSNYDLLIGDEITFKFKYEKYRIVLNAKVIRIDKNYDKITKELSGINYGCSFEKMSTINESIITKYLFDRQLQLYRNE